MDKMHSPLSEFEFKNQSKYSSVVGLDNEIYNLLQFFFFFFLFFLVGFSFEYYLTKTLTSHALAFGVRLTHDLSLELSSL